MRGRTPAYALTLYGIGILVATGTFPVGLYHSYALEFRFSPAMVTLIATSSAIGVVAAVALFGSASDVVGRKPVLLPALLVGMLGVTGMLVAQNVWTLLAARATSGLAIGLFTGAGTAALTELVPPERSRRAATQAATAGVLGFASGPVVGGIFVEYGPWPLRLVYVVGLVLLVPALAGVVAMPETLRQRRRARIGMQRLELPHGGRRLFLIASVVCLCAFAAASFFQSLGPTIAVQLLAVHNLAVAGAVTSCFLATSALAQMRFRSLEIRRQTVSGLVVLPLGLGLIAAGLVADSPPLFILGALVGGFGQGLAYVGGQSLVERAAPLERRGAAFSLYLVVLYVGGSVCAISFGVAAKAFGLYDASVVYALLAALLSLATAGYVAQAALARPASAVAASRA